MKVNVQIECTPEEARNFLGLPDVTEMQKQLTDVLYGRMSENLKTMETGELMQTWLPMMMQGWTEAQKSFWQLMQASATTAPTSARNPTKK